MTDLLFSLVASYGLVVVLLSAYLSCLALPVPTAFVMLAAGAFSASGDMVFWQTLLAAFGGAVCGDQTGFRIGRYGGARVMAFLNRDPTRAKLVARAHRVVDRWGGVGVFFSTWLFAPLGPWVNLAAGAAGLSWLRFTLWDVAGEAIWITFYLSLGYLFSDRITELADILSNSVGLLLAGLAAVVSGYLLRNRLRRISATRASRALAEEEVRKAG